MGRGEVKEFSDIFNHTRHLALQLPSPPDAAPYGAGIPSSASKPPSWPFRKAIHEMMMIGTACHHPSPSRRPSPTAHRPDYDPTFTQTERNLESRCDHDGMAPLKLVLGTAVYSLRIVGGILASH